MQEPDSFSQSLVRLLQFTDTCSELLILRILLSVLFRDPAPLLGRSHVTTLSWNQAPVEITIEDRIAPPVKSINLDALLPEPGPLTAIRLPFVRVHERANLVIGITRRNRHPRPAFLLVIN